MDNTYQELVDLFSKQIVDHVLSFTLRDDILMRYVFSGQRGAVRFLLSRLLGRPLPPMASVETQSYLPSVIKKSKIFDMLATTIEGEIFIVETQNKIQGDEVQRALCYASSECHFLINRGCPYSDLKPINVVFLTGGDAIGSGEPIYSFSLLAEELGYKELPELAFRLYFINLDAPFDGSSRWYVCHDLGCSNVEDMHYNVSRQLLRLGREIRIGGVAKMCESLEQFERDVSTISRAEGREEGLAEGIAIGRAEQAEMREELAKADAEKAKMRDELAKSDAEKAEMRNELAKLREKLAAFSVASV